MKKKPSSDRLVLPEGARVEIVEGGIALEHTGDITLGALGGGPFLRLRSTGGSITLHGEHVFGEIVAEGSVRVEGSITAKRLVSKSGDVTVHGTIEAGEVIATNGSVALRGDSTVRTITAGDELHVEGKIRARSLSGARVRLEAATCDLKGVEGSESVHLGAAAYTVEVVIAPTVTCEPAASGRINVLECTNTPGQNDLKGKFRLAEYAEFTGVDPLEFLEGRGVKPLPEPDEVDLGEPLADDDPGDETGILPELAAEPVPEVVAPVDKKSKKTTKPKAKAKAKKKAPAKPAAEVVEVAEPVAATKTKSTDRSTRVVATPTEDTSDLPDLETTGNTDELLEDASSIEDLDPAALEAIEDDDSLIEIMDDDDEDSGLHAKPVVLDPERHDQLVASVDEMSRTYPERIPQQLARLRNLVDGKQYRVLQIELDALFNALVLQHMKAKTKPHHQVYSSFGTIHDIVKGI